MSSTSLRAALVLTLTLPVGLVGWGAVSAQFRPPPVMPRPPQPVIPKPPPFVPPPIPQPRIPAPVIPPPIIHHPPVIPQINPGPQVFVDRYTCTGCGHTVQVPAGTPPPAICPGCNRHNVVMPPGQANVPAANNPILPVSPVPSLFKPSTISGKTIAIIAVCVGAGVGLLVLLLVVLRLASGSPKRHRPRRRRLAPDFD